MPQQGFGNQPNVRDIPVVHQVPTQQPSPPKMDTFGRDIPIHYDGNRMQGNYQHRGSGYGSPHGTPDRQSPVGPGVNQRHASPVGSQTGMREIPIHVEKPQKQPEAPGRQPGQPDASGWKSGQPEAPGWKADFSQMPSQQPPLRRPGQSASQAQGMPASQPQGVPQPQHPAPSSHNPQHGAPKNHHATANVSAPSKDNQHFTPQNNLHPGQPASRARSPSPAVPLTPLESVQKILSDAEHWQTQVAQFEGPKSSKDYAYLEEMLTRLLLKLDNVDSEGKEEIRNIRRKGVKIVQASLDHLELKAFANSQPDPVTANETNKGSTGNVIDSELKNKKVKEMVLDSEIDC